MLTYTFDNIGSDSMYEYLYRCIKNDIISGTLRGDEHLPSKRSFAKHLGVSTITVENAYGQLISEGYIYTIPKRGYFVADISGIEKIKSAATVSGIITPKESPEYIENFSGNHANPESFPFSIWAKLMRETFSENERELMINSPSAGIMLLRQAVADHLKSFRGMSADPEQIIIGAGTEYLYGVLIQLLGRQKTYCVENPGYQKIGQIYKSHEVTCRYADMDGQGITVEGIRNAEADVVHISPTHHFPTGITMPVSRRYELLAWANEKEERYIIEDDYDSEFRMTGRPIPSLQSIDVSEKVIYINTFSKSLAPTIRISYMVLPPHLVNRFYEKMSFYSCTVSTFEQYTLARFINDGYFEKHINRMRNFYSRQREQVMEIINKSGLKDVCRIIEKDSGLHFLLCLDTEVSDEQLVKRLSEKKIHITALAGYYRRPPETAAHTFIFNYSNLNMERLEEALEQIRICMEK